MMTSRERVKRCINFQHPDRCPTTFPEPYSNDLLVCGMSADPDWKPWQTWEFEEFRQWEDEWHNVWRCLPTTTQGEVIQGVIGDWSDLDKYEMPRLDLPLRYSHGHEMFLKYPDRYHIGTLPGFPFAIMRYMRKIEIFLADVLLYPDEVNKLQRRVVDLLKRCITQWSEAGADGIFFCEDWGTQERLLVSPKLWHEMFEWGFRELVGHAREVGLDIWMHSCGYIKDIIPSLVDIGIKVLQLDQPALSGVDFLANTCGGRTTIWSPVDIQRDLPKGDEAYIRERARELIDKLGSNGGGFICGYYGDVRSLGVLPEWQDWACDEFIKHASATASVKI